MFCASPFQKYKRQLEKLYESKHKMDELDEGPILPGSERDILVGEIDKFIEEEYARAVFEYYKEKKPELIRRRTGEVFQWDEAFGDSFENVSKSLRHSLVGLIEDGGRYKFK